MKTFKDYLKESEGRSEFDDLYDKAAQQGQTSLPFACDAILYVPQTELENTESKISMYANSIEKLSKRHDLVAVCVEGDNDAIKEVVSLLKDETEIPHVKLTKGKSEAVSDPYCKFIVVANPKGKSCLVKNFK